MFVIEVVFEETSETLKNSVVNIRNSQKTGLIGFDFYLKVPMYNQNRSSCLNNAASRGSYGS